MACFAEYIGRAVYTYHNADAVSYTHLDVYKRQEISIAQSKRASFKQAVFNYGRSKEVI